LDTVKF